MGDRRQGERERDGKKEKDQSIGLLPKYSPQLGELIQNSTWISQVGGIHGSSSTALSRCISRKLDGKWNNQSDVGITDGCLTLCCNAGSMRPTNLCFHNLSETHSSLKDTFSLGNIHVIDYYLGFKKGKNHIEEPRGHYAK